MALPYTLAFLALLPGLSLDASTQSGERRVLDFQDEGRSPRWFSVNDTVMGGRSKGGFEIEGGVLKFRGTLNTNGGGFASIRTAPKKLELEGFKGLRLRVKGDGREYSVRLEQSGERGWRKPSYRSTFRTTKSGKWQDVDVAFSEFVPTWRGRKMDRPAIDPARIQVIGITLGDKIDGPFSLDLRSIDAVPARNPDAMTGPMLVLAARDAADLQLVRQLMDLSDAVEAGLVVDVTPVVVLAVGGARAGSRQLDGDAVRTLRARLAFRGEGFQAALVGRDGSVVHRSTRALPVREWLTKLSASPRPDIGPSIGVR